jgi:hypothetical protein
VAEDYEEEDFCVVHALEEPCGTALPDAEHVDSLDEQLLIAVQACNKDDVKALLRQGATLHRLAKETQLTAEMKTVVGESLAALYSAECDARQGSFMNRGAPIAALLHTDSSLRLVQADSTLSEWQWNEVAGSRYKPRSFKLHKTVMYAGDGAGFASICAHLPSDSALADGGTAPYIATCS